MYCQKCHTQLTELEESAQFCRNCGANLRCVQEISKPESNVSSVLLLVFIVIALVISIINVSITKLVYNWYFTEMRYVVTGLWIINGISLILPALAIRNKPMKIIGIVIASILIMWNIYSNVQHLLLH